MCQPRVLIFQCSAQRVFKTAIRNPTPSGHTFNLNLLTILKNKTTYFSLNVHRKKFEQKSYNFIS